MYVHRPLDYVQIYKGGSYEPQSSHQIGPIRPRNRDSTKLEDSSDSEDMSSEDSFEAKIAPPNFTDLQLPFTHSVPLRGHVKSITALAIDKAASRMVSGGGDFHIRLWDFANMNENFMPFRTLDPKPGQPPRNLMFNMSGSLLLVTGGNAKPKIMTRNGRVEFEFVKGDMYISDPRYSKGHTSIITSGEWHPTQSPLIVTSSLDSTVRIWDINSNRIGIEQQVPSLQVIKVKNKQGTKTGAWVSKFTPDGKSVLIAGQDGSYQVYSSKNKFSRPEAVCRMSNPT